MSRKSRGDHLEMPRDGEGDCNRNLVGDGGQADGMEEGGKNAS